VIGADHACDLLVVGAGPAGCAAAVAARRAAPDLAVTVVDAARFPREKLCGGAITGGGLRELELCGLALRVPHAVAAHAALRVGGEVLRVDLPHPTAVVRRLELDADLVAQARAAGAAVLEEAPLEDLQGGVATTGRGTVRYGALVAADGVGGASRRLLGLPAGRRVPLRERVVPGVGSPDLLFDLDAAAAGYGWRFPCFDGGAAAETCGVYSLQRDPGLDAGLARFAEREGLPPGSAERSAIRVFEPGGPVGAGAALLAGEALGVDALAGEGIRYALWSGRIAGTVAARALARGRTPQPSDYRTSLLASRSGLVLELTARVAGRLYGGDQRWRRAAGDRAVAEAFAALVSGASPAVPILGLARRFLALRSLLA
jgi:flavin-dependent dehydrogenase